MVDWIVWYHDGRYADSSSHTPEELPTDGVLAVVIKDRVHGRMIWSRADGYCWQNGTWVPHMQNGIDQYRRLDIDGPKVVLNGFGIGDEDFWRIYHEVLADADQRLPANTELPSPDTPLPLRYRHYCFADLDEVADADLVAFSRDKK